MYDLNDTIVAVSSPSGGARAIVRITGPDAMSVCEKIVDRTSHVSNERRTTSDDAGAPRSPRISSARVHINEVLAVDARLYLFFAPHSYTGEPLAEIHIDASSAIVEELMQNLLAGGLRWAAPGEFTARAYLNDKLDLTQAEAVNEVISSSNRLQLEAAGKLLSGRLTKTAEEIRSALLDCLSLIEAGLDFSGEDIEFISAGQAADRLTAIQAQLEELRAGSIRCETLADLPAIGIAGAPNAGKSSLLNALLGWERSIISEQPKTTRDVLTGVLTGKRKRGHSTFLPADCPGKPTNEEKVECPPFQCVLFDCAGLVPAPDNVLDELAQRAAIEALQQCSAVIFCVDATKPDISEDITIRALIQPKSLVYVATKTDLLSTEERRRKGEELERAFHTGFLPTSAKLASGLDELLVSLERLTAHGYASVSVAPAGSARGSESTIRSPPSAIDTVALTARHRQAVTEAIENVRQAIAEVNRGDEEVAVMMIRAACQGLSEIERQHIDEQVLDRIFSRFCIGK